MNKTVKVFATILACMALTGTCFAAPRGGHGRGHVRPTAPRHHKAPPRHHHERHHHGHHVDHHCGWITLGAAAVGGLIGGLFAR